MKLYSIKQNKYAKTFRYISEGILTDYVSKMSIIFLFRLVVPVTDTTNSLIIHKFII